MRTKSLRYYEFGPFRLNATERLLQMSNQTVSLTPKVFDTLLVLVENSGHVLAKNELMEMLWPDSFVEESSLTQNISLLRRALGDGDSEQQYIETIPKRGYRFVAQVRTLEDPVAEVMLQERTTTEITIEEQQIDGEVLLPGPVAIEATPAQSWNRTRTRALYVCGLIVLAGVFSAVFFYANRKAGGSTPNSIAILPFKTIGQDQSDAELQGLGIADALINRLSRLERPVVLPTSSITKYTNREKDVLAIGRALGVDVVLDGTVQRDGQRVRVTAQLIRITDGKPIWSVKYDEEYRDIFALQDSIAGQMVPALAFEISPDSRKGLAGKTTDNAEAYKAYVTGIFFWNRRSKESLTKAIDHLGQAVQKDPNFALAHAFLADCHYLDLDSGFEILPTEQALARAYSESETALSLDEGLAEAHTVKAGLRLLNGDRLTADKEFRRALELNPNYAVARLRYGYLLFGDGKLTEALAEMKRAQQLDPASHVSNSALGLMQFISRDYDGAINSYKRAIELQPNSSTVHSQLVDVYIERRMFDEAMAETEIIRPLNSLASDYDKTHIYAALGRRDEALRMLRALSEVKERPIGAYDNVIIYAALGDNSSAFEWLEKVRLGSFNRALLKFDPRIDTIRSDPRFAEFLKRHP
jgi:DNA-binding winged helix-turn-helix (wHTH) protein/TolB-like protein/Tfp pilus assembly protein PilF